MRRILILLCAALASVQAATDPKPKAADYEVHGRAGDVEIGAEFMIHSFSGEGQTYIAKDYLVVEVALYPPKGQELEVNPNRFALQINGKKQMLTPVTAEMVAASLQHQDWQSGPHLEAGGGMGNTGVVLGRPRPTTVPGGQQPPVIHQPRAPDPDNPSGIESKPPVRAEELVVQTAFPTGKIHGSVSGFLYFPYKGRSSGIKTLDLIYDQAVVKLR